jgi:periplasmic protein TonB
LVESSDISDRISKEEVVRWASCGAVVLAAHVLFIVAVLARPDFADAEAGSPIVMVDLAPVASAPSNVPSDQPPAPQVQTESQERVRQDEQRKEKPPEEQVDETPTQSEVTLPKREPDPPKETQEEKVKQEAQEASHAAAPQNAPVVAALPAAPAPGRDEEKTSVAIATWERSLAVRLETSKRYPVRAHGEKGVAQVTFRLDRNGHVLSSKIVQSSGSAILDDEALATLKRADPFPHPPSAASDDQLTIVTSIRYKLPKER